MRVESFINGRLIFLFCLIGYTLGSCKSYYAGITIETPVPAKEDLPANIQSLTLMNRSINNQYLDHQEDTLENYFYKNNYQLSAIVLDIDASDTTLLTLAELLYVSGRYDIVVPEERNFNREIAYNLVPDTLNTQIVRQICEEYNTDALMVLEQFSTKAMTDFNAERMESYNGNYYHYYASLDLKYDAYFRIYKPGNQPIDISLSDTIYWESSDDILELMMNKLPSIKQALINAGIKVALDVDAKISPVWLSEKRGYFILTRKNDPGKRLMDENNTEEARDYWLKMAQSDKKKIKGRAEYNLALVSELDGDIDQAIEWALKSYNTYYQYQTEIYLKKLDAIKKSKLTK